MCSDRAVEPSSGSNVIPRRACPGLAGLRPHMAPRPLSEELGVKKTRKKQDVVENVMAGLPWV